CLLSSACRDYPNVRVARRRRGEGADCHVRQALRPLPNANQDDHSASSLIGAPAIGYQMVLTLERAGFIRRQPGVRIEVLVPPDDLPVLASQHPTRQKPL